MATPLRAAKTAAPPPPTDLLGLIVHTLDEGKAQDLVVIDLRGKSSIADHMVVATGTSTRQVSALAEQVLSKLKDHGHGRVSTEGKTQGDWVLLDAGDVIVHLFRPEVRAYYNLEKMWNAPPVPERMDEERMDGEHTEIAG